MRRLEVEVSDGVANALVLIAELAGISFEDEVRVAVNAHVVHKITAGDLGPVAKKALSDIEEETLASIEAIARIFDLKMDDIDVSPRHGTPRPRVVRPAEPKQRMGFAPPSSNGNRPGHG